MDSASFKLKTQSQRLDPAVMRHHSYQSMKDRQKLYDRQRERLLESLRDLEDLEWSEMKQMYEMQEQSVIFDQRTN
jgi:aspartate/methionine/tyrosine aminotransferase